MIRGEKKKKKNLEGPIFLFFVFLSVKFNLIFFLIFFFFGGGNLWLGRARGSFTPASSLIFTYPKKNILHARTKHIEIKHHFIHKKGANEFN
jgi:hypothetical protein